MQARVVFWKADELVHACGPGVEPNSFVWKVCYLSHESCVRRDIHAAWMRHSGAWTAFSQWVNTIREASQKSVTPEHALYAARNIVIFIQGGDTLSEKVMEDLSSTEHKSVVDESSSIVLSLLKRECDGAHWHMLSERVRRLTESALQQGLECSRRATHKWLSQAFKRGEQVQPTGGVGKRRRSPSYRWLSETVTETSRQTRNVWRNCMPRVEREWGGEDAIGFVEEINS